MFRSSGLDGEEGHMKHLLIYIMKHVLISCMPFCFVYVTFIIKGQEGACVCINCVLNRAVNGPI